MPRRPIHRAALAAACILLLSLTADAAGGSAAFLSKRGASGQVYLWSAGSC